MAACLIPIIGTSGNVLIRYTESGVEKELIAGIGNIYLEDTVTDLTYTTLSGDAAASSGCFTIVANPSICYKLSWDNNNLEGYSFDSVNIDGDIISLSSVDYPNSGFQLGAELNSLNLSKIKAIQAKIETISGVSNTSYVLKVSSVNAPIFKIVGPDAEDILYLIPETSACSIVGYSNLNPCQPIFLP